MLPDDFDGLGSLTDEAFQLTDRRRPDVETALTVQMQAVLGERLYAEPQDGLTLGGAIARLIMLHELKRTGVLTYEEFRGLKTRVLGL